MHTRLTSLLISPGSLALLTTLEYFCYLLSSEQLCSSLWVSPMKSCAMDLSFLILNSHMTLSQAVYQICHRAAVCPTPYDMCRTTCCVSVCPCEQPQLCQCLLERDFPCGSCRPGSTRPPCGKQAGRCSSHHWSFLVWQHHCWLCGESGRMLIHAKLCCNCRSCWSCAL